MLDLAGIGDFVSQIKDCTDEQRKKALSVLIAHDAADLVEMLGVGE